MKVAVIGYSVEGRSALKYWQDLGDQVTVCDEVADLQIPDGVSAQLGPDYLKGLDKFDLIVRSPGVKPRLIFEANPGLDRSRVTSVTNEFLAGCPAPVIGVTGTKGKGTTSTLITKILEAAGHRVWLGGNIGKPALDFLAEVQPEDWVVLEMSSFQLMDITRSPQVAAMLMIAPDHLDYHADMQEYLKAKQNIFAHQGPGDRAVFNACNIYSLQSGLAAPCDPLPYNDDSGAWIDGDLIRIGRTAICTTSEVALPGPHNLENVCAAVAVTWPIIQDVAPITHAIRSFSGLEHRLETVGKIGEITYVNDSYSPNPGSTIAALHTYSQPKVVILGGTDRNLPLQTLAKQLAHTNVRRAILVGELAPRLVEALEAIGFKEYSRPTGGMPSIVAAAAEAAQPGDVVLLSPGAPSFDMFTNFTDRGQQFKAAVHNLEGRA